MRGERYPKYKPTGIAWLPEVPEGWECVRLGVLGTLSNGLSKGGESFGTGFPFVAYGDVYRNSALPIRVKGLVQSSSAEQKACSVLRGDVFFTRTSESIEEIGFSSVCLLDLDKATFAGFLIRFRPRGNEALPEFSRFYFRNFRLRVYFQLRISGLITRASLSQSVLRDLPVLLPPLPTQRAIVAYLDEKCGKVDRLVAAKEKEAALLKELKQSMIAEAVCGKVKVKGEGEQRKMKPSGIQWLPEVPEGWEVRKMKYLFVEKSDKGHPAEQPLCSTQAHGVIPQSLYENWVVVVNKEGLGQLKLVKVGDFVISLRSFQGGIEIAHYQGIISAAYTILEPRDEKCSPYFRYLFKSHKFIQLLQTCVTGIREGQNINYPLLSRKFIPIPPLAEQRAIVAYIEVRAAKIDAAVKGLEREVAALKEYKQRLIADVVTGQRKVA